jgi:hypothetical protein
VAAINEEELTKAIQHTLVAHRKIPDGEAKNAARMVLGYFGLEDAVLDNKLTSEDRDRFYQLEEEGLLSSEEEDATVSRGKTWRIHYWLLKKAKIRDVGQHTDAPNEDEASAIYKGIADSAWSRSSPDTKAKGAGP